MASEKASTLFGFETPEQVRQRIGKVEQAQAQGMFGGSLNDKIFQAAMSGGTMLGQGLAQAAGYEAPEVKLAKQRQEIMANVDLTDRDSLLQASRAAGAGGDTKLQIMLADKYLEIAPKEGKISTSLRKQRELENQGVPTEIAQGIGFGTYRVVQDPDTGDQYVVDLRQNGNRVPSDVQDAVIGHVQSPNQKYKPKLITKGNKAEIRLQKNVKELSEDMIKTGAPQLQDTLETVEAIIDNSYKNGKGDLPGFGATASLPDWAISQQGQDLRQSAIKLFNIELKERSGAAVTKQELDRLRNEFKQGVWRTDRQFVEGIKAYRRLMEDYKAAVVAGYDPAVVSRYVEQGGLPLKQDVKGRNFGKKSSKSKSKITEAQIRADGKKFNWTEKQIQAAIKQYVRN